MAVTWTDEQKKVISARGRDILVSAAAGSGKTAVLVERIVNRITDPSDPVNVNELLVVTFTRAAAAEMKERLNAKLSALMEEYPEDPRLAKQAALLPQAHISTIDSFCQWLVKQYFFLLDIDPDLRIAEAGEDKLLREDCIDRAFAEAYEKDDPDFRQMMDSLGGNMDDRKVREMVLAVEEISESMPWPEKWLALLEKRYDGSIQALSDEEWFVSWEKNAREKLGVLSERLKEAAHKASEVPDLSKYADMFVSDRNLLLALMDSASPEQLYSELAKPAFMRRPALGKKADVDPALKDSLTALRDQVKKDVKDLFPGGSGDISRESALTAQTDPARRALVVLTRGFCRIYEAEKKKRELATFSDIEHLALQLLWRWEGEELVPTDLQREVKGMFREVMTDEYQDSNLVQEEILRAFGKEEGGPGAYRFMVGDVKQSIYRFRMARPELFMEKYEAYSPADDTAGGLRIDLGKNFRSRDRILESVNSIFRKVMTKEFGGVAYEGNAELRCGASYGMEDPPAELLICNGAESGLAGTELEAAMIADKIRELTDPDSGLKLWDAERKAQRPVSYRDIVILVRSAESMAEPFRRTLMSYGIPAHAQESKGYFSAPEVQVLLSFLKIIDDPLQDIPLAAVLLSPIGGFTDEELAFMCAGEPDGFLLTRLKAAAAAGRHTEKFGAFMERLSEYRKLQAVRPIHEILLKILDETDYLLTAAAQPGGAVRKANVEMLIEKAAAFEETSYRGIFRFLKYIERLQEYKQDEAEASALSENEELVRIMTIHKSKGMEFPVVFVAGTGRGFNLQDARAPLLMHPEMGLACDLIDPEYRMKVPLLSKRMMMQAITKESKAEELRVLYVAMTRAKEKLILTAAVDDLQGKMEKYAVPGAADPEKAGTYLDWILMAMEENVFDLTVKDAEEEERGHRGYDKALAALRRDRWKLAALEGREDDAYACRLKKLLSSEYPYKGSIYRKGVISVSEIKKLAEKEAQDAPGPERKPAEMLSSAPEAGGTATSGAIRGTAYHLVMKHIDPASAEDPEGISSSIRVLVEKGLLSEEEAEMIDPQKISRFWKSVPGRTAKEAAAAGRLFREQPVIKSLAVRELEEMTGEAAGEETEEWIILQGIIDAYAVTEKGIVLWDYKTDRVHGAAGEKRLLDLYETQLRLYAEALEAALEMPVTEVYLYSFALEKAIKVNL